MKKEDFIALGLDEATAEKAAKASAEELKGFIPKTRFDEVNEAKNKLEKDIKARDEQLERLKQSTGDVEALKKQIEDLQKQNAADKANYEAQMTQLKIDNAVNAALTAAKAKNNTAVKALLADFLAKAELDGDSVKGLDAEIKKLTESEDTKFLFNLDTKPSKPNFRGFVPGEHKEGAPGGGEKPKTLAEAIQMRYQADFQQ